MEDCVFCNIIKGSIPSLKVYEDEHTLAFMDIAKDVDGHILVIPKKHTTNILDAEPETLHRVMDTVHKVAKHCVDRCGYEGVNVLNANHACAGQTVFHLHFHIIPRNKNDGVHGFPAFPGSKKSLEDMHRLLAMQP
ncbi:MAG: HIT family protein [Treponema sp.]